MKIVIFGGGIAGLTIAHELLNKNFQVTLIEQDEIVGGMSRSRREVNNIPSEHSWRGYGPFYKNTFDILKQIPDGKKNVYDNLSLPIDFYILRDNVSTYKPTLNIFDTIIIVYYFLLYFLSNHRKQVYYKTKFVPLIQDKLSNDGYAYIVDFGVGPGFGMEKKNVSMGHYLKVPTLDMSGTSWSVMTKPTNEAWFNPWLNYLKSKGLQVMLNTTLTKFNYTNNNIVSCLVKQSGKDIKILADDYIVAINPFNAEQIFKYSQMDNLYNQHKLLNKNTQSRQVSFRIKINKYIKYPIRNIAFVMSDSEFNITWYPQDMYFNTNYVLWSGTAVQPDNIGKLYNKKGTDLTKQEFINEIKHQILRSKSFQKLIYDNNKFYITDKDITYAEIWYEWTFKPLVQRNTKWVNDVYNEEYRPMQNTEYSNLYLAGAHTQTSINIWSMEGAVESGKIVSNLILKKYNKPLTYVFTHTDILPTDVGPLRLPIKYIQYMDDVLYTLGLPNILQVFMILIIMYMLMFLYKKNN